jgi:hypothetical protein
MTTYTTDGWGWDSSTDIVFEGVGTPISAIAGAGVIISSGQSLGVTGGVLFAGDVVSIEIWLVDGNGNYIKTLSSGSVDLLSSNDFTFNTSFSVTQSGTYGIAAVYYDSNGNLYGGCETDFSITVTSGGGGSGGGGGAQNPTVTIYGDSSFTGTGANGNTVTYTIGQSGSFVQGSNVTATCYFVTQGGSPIDYTLAVTYNGRQFASQDIGTISSSSNVNTATITFPFQGTGNYVIEIMYPAVDYSTYTAATSITPLTAVSGTIPTANLVITAGPTLSKTQISPGGNATISVTIQNTGGSPSTVQYLSLSAYTGDPNWNGTTVTIPEINPAQSYTATASYSASMQASGTVTICAVILTESPTS